MRKCITLVLLLSLPFLAFPQPTHKEVYLELLRLDILNPFVVLQQAIAETNCGKAGVGLTKNNLFGFKDGSGYKTYKSWKQSVKDYAIWQNKWYCKHLEECHTAYDDCDYYHFIWAIGYVDGKEFSKRGRKYIEYVKLMKPRI